MTIFAEGILPTRGSIMLDLVTLGMLLILILIGISIRFIKQERFELHKKLQVVISVIVLVVVIAFEVDMRFFTDWRELAIPSPLYESGWVMNLLLIHLCFAIPTPFVWGVLLIQAFRNFSNPPAPNHHSHWHKKWGWGAVLIMTMTAITGWIFYYVAFVMS